MFIFFWRANSETDFDAKKNKNIDLQKTLREVIAASELLHNGFSNWRMRLIEAGVGETFPSKAQTFLSDFFEQLFNCVDIREISNSKSTTLLCRQVVEICRQSSCVIAGGIFVVDNNEETTNFRLGKKVYFSNEKEIPQNGNFHFLFENRHNHQLGPIL